MGLSACSPDDSVEAEVVRVVDGDTFEAQYGGATKMVRLLNIDTPETKHPNKIVECQGPEATEFLQNKLPPGSTVTLRFDEEKTDRFDRVLAAAFVGDELVNASIARVGLGTAVTFGANDKYYDDVKAAQDEAAQKKAGLFQEGLACSPAVIAEEQIAALAAPAEPGAAATSAEIAAAAAALGTTIATASAVRALFNDAKAAVVIAALGAAAAADVKAEEKRKAAAAKAKAAEKKRLAEEKRRAEERAEKAAAQAAEQAAAAAAARAAAEAEAAARAAAEAEAARRAAPPAPRAPAYEAPKQNNVAPAPAPTQQNPYPGYTGPRCYAPGGKSWRPC